MIGRLGSRRRGGLGRGLWICRLGVCERDVCVEEKAFFACLIDSECNFRYMILIYTSFDLDISKLVF